MSCDICKRLMPETHQMRGYDGENPVNMQVCAICGLEYTNTVHGLPHDTPFRGTEAHKAFVRAVNFLGDLAPDWAKRVAAGPKSEPGVTILPSGNLVIGVDESNP